MSTRPSVKCDLSCCVLCPMMGYKECQRFSHNQSPDPKERSVPVSLFPVLWHLAAFLTILTAQHVVSMYTASPTNVSFGGLLPSHLKLVAKLAPLGQQRQNWWRGWFLSHCPVYIGFLMIKCPSAFQKYNLIRLNMMGSCSENKSQLTVPNEYKLVKDHSLSLRISQDVRVTRPCVGNHQEQLRLYPEGQQTDLQQDITTSPTKPNTLDTTTSPTKPNTLDTTTMPTKPNTLDTTTSPTKPKTFDTTTSPTKPNTLDTTTSPTKPNTLDTTTMPTNLIHWTLRPRQPNLIYWTLRPRQPNLIHWTLRPCQPNLIHWTLRPRQPNLIH
ncbi:hypothetical protein MAR_033540 [Mya arenaria]|uniref:Uncharacterized protein n=1 Tax=Mya arenaria TaxID=6604 RepID=A0ABY7GCM3_MYAAR|nr:hypothetical protein MAR_033540 [Mya arenaria]